MTRSRVIAVGLSVAVIGGLVWAIGLVTSPHDAWLAYLAGVIAMLTIALGALALVLMAHLTDATWFVVLRRVAEMVAESLPVLVLLLVPLGFGLSALYPWLTPAALPAEIREAVVRKQAYLNLPFFGARAAIYAGAWLGILAVLRRWSARQDAGERPAPPGGAAAAAAIVLGFTLTFASFDWLMSLQPEWWSTVYGVRVFAATVVPALALMAVLMRSGPVPAGAGNAQALASLQASFLLFWFYIAFSQLLIVWIGNEPHEIAWYLPRARGAWVGTGVVLLIGHFVLPFLLLLRKRIKRSVDAMARLGWWLLAMHAVDIGWLVFPGSGATKAAAWLYVAALAFTGGLTAATAAWRFGDRPAVPERDPDLLASLQYEYEDA